MRVRFGGFMSTLLSSSPSSTTLVRPKALSPNPRIAIEVRIGLPFIAWMSTPARLFRNSGRSFAPLPAISSALNTCTIAGMSDSVSPIREAYTVTGASSATTFVATAVAASIIVIIHFPFPLMRGYLS